MTNRLASATSPYLRQHAGNPVDWWEWGDEAFAQAASRDVPVLLSIGYAACHWCHVMAHETFENPALAAQMNAGFVCIKVDREERPDIDSVYMAATVAMTGQGGWPMTCFLTPDGEPFYCGTYFPPARRGGQPGFGELLAAITQTWEQSRGEVDQIAEQARAHLAQTAAGLPDAGIPVDDDLARSATTALIADEDPINGGLGRAPKFPPSATMLALLRHDERVGSPEARAVVERTAIAMARGGIYDQLAGGFARYAVDEAWVVPHFEKMLYDNALLLRAYAQLAPRDGPVRELARRVCEQTVAFLDEVLGTPYGFASSLDADTDGVEGATYAWTPAQLVEVLGEDDGRWAVRTFGVTDAGTFEEGASTLRIVAPPDDVERHERIVEALRTARDRRPQPARDDKVVTVWNALAITALAEAGIGLHRTEWVQRAAWCAGELLDRHIVDGQLRRASLDGAVGEPVAMLDDHAALVVALLSLYCATGEQRWRTAALDLLDRAIETFADAEAQGSWFDAPADGGLIVRPRDPADGATPSGAALMGEALVMASMLADPDTAGRYNDLAAQTVGRAAILLARAPRAAGHWLAVTEAWLAGPMHVTASSADMLALAREAAPGYAVVTSAVESGFSADQPPETVLVCRGTTCSLPLADSEAIRSAVRPSWR
ncbi:MAG TPA: thioredoxin domain-containing protein [Gordonia sp. (in: high G+C Gram-positive bacteria)]|uniref:thioredoxin domain-containing protein n=1 Tax=unclassified Gordonia (in: high G+C Gram-positive bacteria) TaxID=2657482 RepID=UPI000FBC57A3|nr:MULTISPECIES: thioredoxin domain-containing protein [unclassified Gordonia (in: high G+C Gram-positive bacteria)]RTL05841.1 MAG: thioredoxin domain-containing protein [Acidimicrobiia bacterium]HNP55755.1 thioredoxin domain-containing protein [Gordonia sp. (in: high G+C Gram-positive bacteria)]HRC49491.1 thioredoxin domain-containing protein [Gordonia sp. (in: high G+C Gram-positive bacteria)]